MTDNAKGALSEAPLVDWLRNYSNYCKEYGWEPEARRVAEAAELLEDVAESGVDFDHPGLDYVVVQIDRETWEALRGARR